MILDSILFKPCYFGSGQIEINQELKDYTKNIKVNKRFTNLDLDFEYNIDIDKIIKEQNLDLEYELIPEIKWQ